MHVKIAERDDRGMRFLGVACTAVVGLYLSLLQSGIASYAGVEMGAAWLSRFVMLLYIAGLSIASIAVLRGNIDRRTSFPVYGFLAIAFIPLLSHIGQTGPVTKSYLVGLMAMSAMAISARTVDLRRIAQFSASVICVASLCCLLDVCFYDGFSNASGRAAFLYLNPNVAALALLLGAVASAWAIPLKWLPAFLVLVAGAVFSTLSRSAMLMGALTLVACLPTASVDWRGKFREMKKGTRAACFTLIGVLALLGIALHSNPAFSVALDDGFHGLTTITRWLKIAGGSGGGSSIAGAAGTPDMTVAIQMVEANNSASARALLAERALHQFVIGPATGIGLERAFAMAPHNSYLLFADAFGWAGWLIVPVLLMVLFYIGGKRALPASALVALSALFSHDLLFAMPLVAPLALILASVSRKEDSRSASDRKSLPILGAVAIAIALLCIVTDLIEQGHIQPYTQEFSGHDIKLVSGDEFYVPLPKINPPGIFRLGAESKEGFAGGGIAIYENGTPLALANQRGQDIANKGHGRFGFHNMWALFSSTDGSDPSTNGRAYRVDAFVTLHPLFLLCVLAAFTWAAIYSVFAFDLFGMQSRFGVQRVRAQESLASMLARR